MRRALRILQVLALAVSVALVITLARQVQSLRADVSEARHRLLFPRAGDVVPPFDAMDLSGTSRRVGEGPTGTRQVLLVFNTACPICIENAPAWRHLDSVLRGTPGTVILGWSQHADSLTRPYVQEHRYGFDVVVPDLRWLRAYKVEGVPTSLVVGDGGRILYARSGALTRGAIDSLVVVARGGD